MNIGAVAEKICNSPFIISVKTKHAEIVPKRRQPNRERGILLPSQKERDGEPSQLASPPALPKEEPSVVDCTFAPKTPQENKLQSVCKGGIIKTARVLFLPIDRALHRAGNKNMPERPCVVYSLSREGVGLDAAFSAMTKQGVSYEPGAVVYSCYFIV